jgi:serine protease inhibitor
LKSQVPTKSKKAFVLKPNQGPNFTLMNAYNKKYFEPLLSKDYYQEFINDKYNVFWLQPAYKEGYQLKPTNIEIKKEKGYYDCKAKVDYTKDGKTQTSTINGHIQLNENGRITSVRFIEDDSGIWKLWKGYNQP